ncbi:hypothetical protein [Pseudolactococcus hodotermopsidis]|nr:hypothetical protein [Lactococcus hodotermopsidis]
MIINNVMIAPVLPIERTTGWTILQLMNGSLPPWAVDKNFNGASQIIKFFNIFRLDNYFHLNLYYRLFCNVLAFIVIFNLKKKLAFIEFFMILITILFLNIFDFYLLKEPAEFVFVMLVYLVLKSKLKFKEIVVLSSVIFLGNAIQLRAYYGILVVFPFIYFVVLKSKYLVKSSIIKKILFILSIMVTSYLVMFPLLSRISPEFFDVLLNRTGELQLDANTSIRPIFLSTNFVSIGLNYFLKILRICFPIEIVLKGINQIIFFVVQCTITFFTIRTLKNFKNNNKIQNYSLCIVLSFIFLSAMFEPDFGSWVRHEMVMFPIQFLAFGFDKQIYLKYNEDGKMEC